MKNYLKIFAPVALVFVIGLMSFVFAQTNAGGTGGKMQRGAERGFDGPRGFPPSGFHPGMLEQLNLTAEQRTQIGALQENARATSQVFFEKLKTLHEELQAATANGAFSEEQIRQILNNRAAAQIETEIIRLRADAAVINLLTAEQRARLEQLKKERPDFGPGGRRQEGGMPPAQD